MIKDIKAPYFDSNFHKQIKPFPKKWMDASRFKVGDKIIFLTKHLVHIPCEECKAKDYYHYNGFVGDCESRDLNGQMGVVEEVNSGNDHFPPTRHEDVWIGQSCGWLTVRFPFDSYGQKEDGQYKPRACCLEDENIRWKKVE